MKQYAAIDDTVYFWFAANTTSGSGGDGASPAADVRLAGAAPDAAPVYSPTPSLLSHMNYPAGAYEIAITASVANGFATGNTYAVFCTLAIDSQNPTGFVGSFDTKPVESNPTQLAGVAQSLTDLKDLVDTGYNPVDHKVQGVVLADTVTALTGHTAQAGDSFTIVNEIIAHTGELRADWHDGGRLDLLLDAILLDTGTDGVVVASGSKTGYALTATGADLILKDSTFALAIADAIWDEILTGATHNIATSAGRRVREIAGIAIHTGTAQAATATTITLAAAASGGDGVYNRNLLAIISGTGQGQTRVIVDYDNTSKICLLSREWRVTPDATSEYQILAADTPLVVDHGLTQASTNSTITIRAYASAINDVYKNAIITIMAGTGRGQSGIIMAYNGTTKVVTLCSDWETNPDTTSVYAIMPYGISSVACMSTDALADINTQCDTALADYDGPTRTEATSDKDAIITEIDANETKIDLLNDITVADIIAGISDGTYDLQEMQRIMFAAITGKSSGGGTVTLKFRNSGDTKDRITATVDNQGNRQSVVLDGS
jgi:hypothetical protein